MGVSVHKSVNARNRNVSAYNARKRWLSVTSLIDGLVSREIVYSGDTLTIYFSEYGTKTKYPDRSWYIKPILLKGEDPHDYIYPEDLQCIFPGFQYLNLPKKSLINPDRIQYTRANPNKIWKITINTEGKEFIGSDGEPHRYFSARMSYVPMKDMYGNDIIVEYVRE